MSKYSLEFILSIHHASPEAVKNAITEFGEGLQLVELEQGGVARSRDFRVQIQTEDPTVIFDTCAQFGRIKSVKIDEERGG